MSTNWKFWNWRKQHRQAVAKLEAKIARQHRLLKDAHYGIHHGMAADSVFARRLRDRITQELGE